MKTRALIFATLLAFAAVGCEEETIVTRTDDDITTGVPKPPPPPPPSSTESTVEADTVGTN